MSGTRVPRVKNVALATGNDTPSFSTIARTTSRRNARQRRRISLQLRSMRDALCRSGSTLSCEGVSAAVLLFLHVFLFILLAAPPAGAQTTNPTEGGVPSGLAQGAGTTEVDKVNLYNGNLAFRLPLLNISGRGGAGASLTLARNSIHWVVERQQDRQFVTYSPKPEFKYPIRLPFYEPARLYVQHSTSQGSPCLQLTTGQPATTLKRFVFVAADGTEHELRDQINDGQPLTYTFAVGGSGAARGTVFRSADGSGMTFISDTPIFDNCSNSRSENGTGYLLLRDGTRLRFGDGLVQSIRDRNGNTVTLSYGTDLNDPRNYRRLIAVNDSLNRTVSITYSDFGIVNPAVLLYDQITFRGFGGAPRSIKVWYSDLGAALRGNYTLQSYNCLFPNLNANWTCGGSGGSPTLYTATVVNKVELPDGRFYRLYYNPYRELARVELPTGGAVEYDYSPQNPDYSTTKTITRRVAERRMYVNSTDTSPASKQVYSSSQTSDTTVTPFIFTTTSVVEYHDPNNLILTEKHFFHGLGDSKTLRGNPPSYKVWDEGLEFQTDILNSSGTLIKSIKTNWQQRAHVSWWPQQPWNNYDSQANEPIQDPRIADTTVILADTNQQSKRVFLYSNDLHNNVTDVYEYDYGSGTPGSLLRRTHTDYLTTNPVNNINYADPANGQSYTLADPHLRSLMSRTSVYDVNGNEVARTTREYDNHSNSAGHAPLTDRSAISGLDPGFTTGYTSRGNVTGTTSYLLTNGIVTGSVSVYSQYDIAGNAVKLINANGYATTLDYTDNFGAPNAEARLSSAPLELSSQGKFSYAVPTLVTNALNHKAYAQFDYYTGRPVDTEDVNGVVMSGYSENDALDRPTKVVRAANQDPSVQSQTTFNYNDVTHLVTTTSDQNAYNDNSLKSQVVYDGLGRTSEVRTYEGGSNYIAVQQLYDALGRSYKSSNPFRPWQSETPVWTTISFDVLGRPLSVTTPDGSIGRTAYSGNRVLVTDQIGMQRISQTNAIGQLKEIWEITAPDSATAPISFPLHPEVTAGYRTAYEYDSLSNLTTINQGVQTRTFVYDSLMRLTSATNPESGTVNYQYDNNGNLSIKTDARNVSIHYSYDALDRLVRRWYNGSNLLTSLTNNNPSLPSSVGVSEEANYFYDSQILPSGAPTFDRGFSTGKLVAAVYVTGGSEGNYFGYDALGRPLRRIQRTGTTNYEVSAIYNRASAVTSETYPSNRTVTYDYDLSGRTNSFSGSLGDSLTRTYATGILYSSLGGMAKEQFGTDTALFNKSFYNSRGQLSEIRVGTTYTGPTDSSWNRGALINHYSNQCLGACNGTDNNGNLKKQEHRIPKQDQPQPSIFEVATQEYDYDNLNRLKRVHEGTALQQEYVYDRYGNRTIHQTNSWGLDINKKDLTVNTANNQLGVPGGQPGAMTYDNAGNLTNDTYTGAGSRTYDGENRMTQAWGGNNQQQYYTYNADGQRVRRKVDGVETWQIYGMNGELLAEYPANGAKASPQKEYGYRNGQLLITAAAGASSISTQNVSWTSAFGVTVTGNSLQRTSGGFFGGAASSQSIASGTGYVEFTATETDKDRWFGLSNGNSNPNSWDVDFAVYVGGGGLVEVVEAGVTKASFGPYAVGDVFRVSVANGVVKYSKNGTVFYTSTTTPTYPLLADSSLSGVNGTITNAIISGNLAGGSGGGVEINWLVMDHLGTPRMIIDQTGSLANVKRHDYLPYGEELTAGQGIRSNALGYNADTIRQKFTSKERDNETGLDFFDARYYSKVQGRFTGADTVGGNVFSPQTLNLYSYVSNNPLIYNDPTGHAAQDTHQQQDPNQQTGTAPPCWPNCQLPPKHLPVIKETVTVPIDPNEPTATTDTLPVTELQLRTGQENPLPEPSATSQLLEMGAGQGMTVSMGTVAVGTLGSGGTGVAAGAGAITGAILGAVVYDLLKAIGEAIADAIPRSAPPDDPTNQITLFRGLDKTNPGAFRVDPDGVSVFEAPPPGYKYALPIRATYQGKKVPGTIATLIDPGLRGGIAVYTPQLGGPLHWSLNFPGQSAENIKSTLSQFAKDVLK